MINYTADDITEIAVLGTYIGLGCFTDLDCYAVELPDGHVGLAMTVCSYAEYLYGLVKAGDSVEERQSVFEYEVAEPFGLWFRNSLVEHGKYPAPNIVRAYLLADVRHFFLQGLDSSDAVHNALDSALMAVPFPFWRINMSKILTASELAQIITRALTTDEIANEDQFRLFFCRAAELVAEHFGGEIGRIDSPDGALGWTVAVSRDEAVPEDGGIWRCYDLEGDFE